MTRTAVAVGLAWMLATGQVAAQPGTPPSPPSPTPAPGDPSTPSSEETTSPPAPGAPAPAKAETRNEDDDSLSLYSVPDVPALTALDATSNRLDRPESAKGVAASVATLIDETGRVKSGVGIEISARAFGVDRTWSYYQYRHDWWRRLVSRSALSLGSSKTSTDPVTMTSDTKAAIGARIVLWDQTDPLLDRSYTNAVDYARAACAGKPRPERPKCEEEAYNGFDKWEDPKWNAGAAFIGLAQTWDFADSKLDSYKAETFQVWGAVSLPLGDIGQVAVGGAYQAAYHGVADTGSVGTRVRLGGSIYRFVGDGTWYVTHPDGAPWGQWAVGAELKVSKGSWLTLSAGTDLGGSEDISILSSLKWGFAKKPSWER